MTDRPAVGDRAPGFSAPDAHGDPVDLDDLLGGGPVVLFFYPRDHSWGCTKEACRFRDDHEAFVEAGATVVGVSPDPPASHRRFADDHDLPFLLLSDQHGTVRDRYGVGRTLGLIPGRVTFVLDDDGVVRHVFDSQVRPTRHVEEALDVVRDLKRMS